MKQKRWFVLILVIIMIANLCSGCGKDKDISADMQGAVSNETKTDDISRAKYAYKATYLPLTSHDGSELNYVNYFCISGENLFFTASYEAGVEKPTNPETGEPILDENTGKPLEYAIYEEGTFRVDLTSGQVSLLEGYEKREIPDGFEGDTYVQSMSAGTDGTFWMLQTTNTYFYDVPENTEIPPDQIWNYYQEGEQYYDMSHYSAEGQKLTSVQLQVPSDVYIGDILIDSDGNIYTSDWQNVYIFDNTGVLVSTITSEQGLGQLVRLSENQIGITRWDSNGENMVFVPIDPSTGAFGEEIALVSSAYDLYPGFGEYSYLYLDGDNVYGYVEGAETGEKLLSWMDSDVDSGNINQFAFLPDGRVAALEMRWSSEGSSTNLILMEQVDPSVLPQKRELILGCISLDWQLRPMIVDFNRSHSDVRIVVKDYLEYATDGDYQAAIQKLNTEILSGKTPDLLCLAGLPVEQYAAKGILADLWPMIDSDPEIGREDLMEHLFDVMSVDGKLYQLTNSFSVQTAAVRSSIAAGRTSWTLEEVLDALEDLQPGAGIFGETDTKTGILNQCLSYDLNSYMDWTTGQCSFDSPAFISVLEFANSFPAEFDWESYDWETAESEYSRLQTGKQLMSAAYLGDFQELQVQPALHGGDVTYIGFPSESGNGSCFTLGSTISISANCADPDAAWSFARELLLEENQSEDDVWSFPTNKAAFEARAEKKMTPQYYTDPETGEQVEMSQGGIGYGNDFMIELYAIKQKDYDAFMELYEKCNSVYLYDTEVMDIIQAECEAYFAGQKTVEETARLIQNTLSLYIAEHM